MRAPVVQPVELRVVDDTGSAVKTQPGFLQGTPTALNQYVPGSGDSFQQWSSKTKALLQRRMLERMPNGDSQLDQLSERVNVASAFVMFPGDTIASQVSASTCLAHMLGISCAYVYVLFRLTRACVIPVVYR